MKQRAFRRDDSHYVIPLPFREKNPRMRNNKSMALNQLSKLKIVSTSDDKYSSDYNAFMDDFIKKNYVQIAPEHELETTMVALGAFLGCMMSVPSQRAWENAPFI